MPQTTWPGGGGGGGGTPDLARDAAVRAKQQAGRRGQLQRRPANGVTELALELGQWKIRCLPASSRTYQARRTS